MTYKEFDDLKSLIKKVKNDKTKYLKGDILERMKHRTLEEMATIGYAYIESKGTTIEELFTERLREQIADAERENIEGEFYLRMKDLNRALDIIRNYYN